VRTYPLFGFERPSQLIDHLKRQGHPVSRRSVEQWATGAIARPSPAAARALIAGLGLDADEVSALMGIVDKRKEKK